MWEVRASLQHGSELTLMLRTLLITISENFCSGPSLEKILAVSLINCIYVPIVCTILLI